ncbi:hypothetical protein VTK26DRAFT_5905 [Humicola hyalothermophila]
MPWCASLASLGHLDHSPAHIGSNIACPKLLVCYPDSFDPPPPLASSPAQHSADQHSCPRHSGSIDEAFLWKTSKLYGTRDRVYRLIFLGPLRRVTSQTSTAQILSDHFVPLIVSASTTTEAVRSLTPHEKVYRPRFTEPQSGRRRHLGRGIAVGSQYP